MESYSNSKYRLVNRQRLKSGELVYQIQAISKFRGDVSEGDLGGYVSGEHNLSEFGKCWIYKDACVIGDAVVSGDAVVKNNAVISKNASISDNVEVCHAATVTDYAVITGNVHIGANAFVGEHATVIGNVCIVGNAIIRGYALVGNNTTIAGNAIVMGNALISGDVNITGDVRIDGRMCIYNDGLIKTPHDISHLSNYPFLNTSITIYKTKNGSFMVAGENMITPKTIPDFLKVVDKICTDKCKDTTSKEDANNIRDQINKFNDAFVSLVTAYFECSAV